MLQLDLCEYHWQLIDEILLLIVLPEDGWHLLLQVADDVGMNLQEEKPGYAIVSGEWLEFAWNIQVTYPDQTRPLDQVVELA